MVSLWETEIKLDYLQRGGEGEKAGGAPHGEASPAFSRFGDWAGNGFQLNGGVAKQFLSDTELQVKERKETNHQTTRAEHE
jgi:hypothetical protein